MQIDIQKINRIIRTFRTVKISLCFLILFFGTFGWAGNSNAAISITLPYSNDFNESSDLDNISWNENGTGGVAHNQSGGWQGGCVEITPPTTGQTHVGIGAFDGIAVEDIYARMLVKIGPTLRSTATNIGYGFEDKFLIFNRSTSADDSRAMATLEATAGNYYAWASCAPDNTCYYDDGDGVWNPSGTNEWLKYPSFDEWACLEIHGQVGGVTALTLTKQDGASKTWDAGGFNITGGAWSSVFIIGGWWNASHSTDPDNHVYIDELVIDDEPIGIPAGFTGVDATPPGAPSGLAVN